MPFTFAHPAAVLPFARQKFLPMSALVIGSLTPDFQYFLTMKLTGRYGHSFEGLFFFNLPVGILLFLIFHGLVKRPLIAHLPRGLSGRFSALYDKPLREYFTHYGLGVMAAIMLGAATHIVWDSFTHAQTPTTRSIAWLQDEVDVFVVGAMARYRVFQHLSTLVGMAAIAMYVVRLPVNHSKFSSYSFRYWWVVVGSSLWVLAIRWGVGFEYFGDVVASTIASGCIGVVVGGIWACGILHLFK
jgi:hypothetical protein